MGREGREGRINLGPFVSIVTHRGGEEAEDVLSRIIPKFGGSGIPDAAAAVSTSSGWGCRQKGDLSFTWRLRPLGMRAQVRGRLSGFKFGVFRGPIPPLPPVCCLLWSLLDVGLYRGPTYVVWFPD